LAAFTWDVDRITEGDGGWHLLDGEGSLPQGAAVRLQSQEAGTLVVWRKVDFGRLDDRPERAALLAEHLGMVFHRFIRGDARGNILNLFNDNRPINELDESIEAFLLNTFNGSEPKDVLVYYTGHGAFVEGDQRYCLLMPCSRIGALGASAYAVRSLARTLHRSAPNARRFIIIDACFAGAAQADFIPQSDAGSRMEVQAMDALVDSGTALLCAASSADVAMVPTKSDYTMFSGALLDALTSKNHWNIPCFHSMIFETWLTSTSSINFAMRPFALIYIYLINVGEIYLSYAFSQI
jgi:hypothetical protein